MAHEHAFAATRSRELIREELAALKTRVERLERSLVEIVDVGYVWKQKLQSSAYTETPIQAAAPTATNEDHYEALNVINELLAAETVWALVRHHSKSLNDYWRGRLDAVNHSARKECP